ncbi:MAG: hypothetical protein IJP82_04815 [Bacteroidaceae bacterium]|nr:hypothetical protein [Bacteroidaceae bacterium]
MTQTRQWMIAAILTISGTLNLSAQKIQTVDHDGRPIAFAHVMNAEGTLLGVTDQDGILSDVQGAKTLHITHVTCKPRVIQTTDIHDGRIILDDADFNLPEITVTPKDWLYIETYYRVAIIQNHNELLFFGEGIYDNYIDLNSKKPWNDYHHPVKQHYAAKKLYNLLFWASYSNHCMPPLHPAVRKGGKVTAQTYTNGRADLIAEGKKVGYATIDSDKRHVTLDLLNYVNAVGTEKKKKEAQHITEVNDNAKSYFYDVYHVDADGNAGIEDFIMLQWATHGVMKKTDAPVDILIMTYATDHAYLSKKEKSTFKKARKENQITPAQLTNYAHNHGVPPIDAALQAKITQLKHTPQ